MKELIRQQIKVFMISHVVITIVVGTLGMVLGPDSQLGYWAYFVPLLYALMCSVPGVIMYSKHELTTGEIAFRRIIQLLIIEIMILGCLYVLDSLPDISVVAAVAASVAIVYVTVRLLSWMSDLRDTRRMNAMIEQMRETDK